MQVEVTGDNELLLLGPGISFLEKKHKSLTSEPSPAQLTSSSVRDEVLSPLSNPRTGKGERGPFHWSLTALGEGGRLGQVHGMMGRWAHSRCALVCFVATGFADHIGLVAL